MNPFNFTFSLNPFHLPIWEGQRNLNSIFFKFVFISHLFEGQQFWKPESVEFQICFMPFTFQCSNPSKNANTFCWVKSYSCCRHAWDCIYHSVYSNRLDVPFSLFTFRNPGGLISLRHYPIFARSSLKYPVIGKYFVALCIRPLILEIHRVSNQLFFWNYWSHVSYWKIEGIGLTSIFSFFSPSNVGKPNGLIFHQCCSLVSPPSFCIQRDFKPPVVFWIHSPLNFLHPDRFQAIFFNPFSFQCWKGKRFELTMSQNIQPPIFEIQKTKHKT